MLDSEITFKIKVGYIGHFCLRLQLFAFKEFCMETRLSNIFKATNVTNLTKVIQESSYRVLQVTSKQKTLKQHVYFLKAVEFCPTFDIQIDIMFRKKLQDHTFQKIHRNFSKYAKIQINSATHYEITALWKYENLVAPFSKSKLLTFGIFNESNIWAKVYHI